jgi:hypothetical protein
LADAFDPWKLSLPGYELVGVPVGTFDPFFCSVNPEPSESTVIVPAGNVIVLGRILPFHLMVKVWDVLAVDVPKLLQLLPLSVVLDSDTVAPLAGVGVPPVHEPNLPLNFVASDPVVEPLVANGGLNERVPVTAVQVTEPVPWAFPPLAAATPATPATMRATPVPAMIILRVSFTDFLPEGWVRRITPLLTTSLAKPALQRRPCIHPATGPTPGPSDSK